MPRALITGIQGQTGSYTAEILLGQGWDVHGLVHEPALPQAAGGTGAIHHVVDLTDHATLTRTIAELRPDVLINLAAISSVARSWAEPVLTAETNALSVAVMLEAMSSLERPADRPAQFVQASSAEIFGQAAISPQTEETPINPVNPYGASKAYAHALTKVYRNRGLTTANCILYNHESPRRPTAFVTRKITEAAARIALGKQDTLTLGNTEIRRDWGWAPDYARAITMVVEAHASDDFVIATGESHTIGDFVRAAFSAAGIDDWERHIEVDQSLVRPADASEMRGDPTHLTSTLGWKPTKTFEEIVAAMVENDLKLNAS